MHNTDANNVMVSICCVTYNHINYLRKCLDGIVNQKTNFQFEILVHDDASTDGTTDVVKEYEIKFPHLFRNVYQVENQYLKQNPLSNILLKMARGKYIALCEGDDYWTDEHKLQKQFGFMEANHSYSLCFHNVLVKKEFTGFIDEPKLFNIDLEKTEFDFEDTVDSYLAHTSSLFFRGELILPLPEWYDHKTPGDIALIILLGGKGKIKYLDFTGSVYRQNDGGTSVIYNGTHLYTSKIFMLKKVNEYFSQRFKNIIIPVIRRYYLNLAKEYMRNGNILSAIKSLFNYYKPIQ